MKALMLWGIAACLLTGIPTDVRGQGQDAEQLLLNVEKLAHLKRVLEQMKKGYQLLYKGYGDVRDLARGNFDLHSAFLGGLMKASPVVRRYGRTVEIVRLLSRMPGRCASAIAEHAHSGTFSWEELQYLQKVHAQILRAGSEYLEELLAVTTSGKLQMNDAERLVAIDRIHGQTTRLSAFLASFQSSTGMLARQRTAERESAVGAGILYGITDH